mgnify:CR=1 FL=1
MVSWKRLKSALAPGSFSALIVFMYCCWRYGITPCFFAQVT